MIAFALVLLSVKTRIIMPQQQYQYWLMKSEPCSWSWADQVKKGEEQWDGVRNRQASNFMQQMKVGDLVFFYHSGKEKKIVGIVQISREYYPDHTDETKKFGMVDVKTVKELLHPVSLAAIKKEPKLSHLHLCRQSRLSVMPIDDASWMLIMQMSNTNNNDDKKIDRQKESHKNNNNNNEKDEKPGTTTTSSSSSDNSNNKIATKQQRKSTRIKQQKQHSNDIE